MKTTTISREQQKFVEECERQLTDPFAKEKSMELQAWRDAHKKPK